MKWSIAPLIFSLVIGCSSSSSDNEAADSDSGPVDWILGSWEQTNGDSGVATTESWVKKGKNYLGHAYSIQATDTVFNERIQIVERENQWVYVVKASNDKPVEFPLTEVGDSSFICTNLAHDFPTQIIYESRNNMIFASITDGKDSIHFIYK